MTLTQINKAGLDELALDHVFTIGASGSSAYTFQGEGLNGTVNNPTLYLTRGKTYRFENGSGGHPIRIQSTSGASGTAYNTGVTNNAGSGTVIVEVQHDAPDVLYYQCTSHAAMNGILYITGALADNGVTTAKLADDAVTTAKIADSNVTNDKLAPDIPVNKLQVNDAHIIIGNQSSDGTLQTLSGDVSMTRTGAVTIANNAVTTAKIADEAVTLAKLPHGTSSNDGKFLRANNGADPSFETVTSTTINNNADNRIITGSGTANTLEAETGFTYNGNLLHINSGSSGLPKIRLQHSASGNDVFEISSGLTGVSNGGFGIYDVDSTVHRLAIDSSGNVGINNTSPKYVMHLNPASGQSRIDVHMTNSTTGHNNNDGVQFGYQNSAGAYIWNFENTDIYFGTNGTKRASFLAGGGLAFNNDTAQANALDDYEEGTWTPTIRGPGGTGTHGAGNAGFYTKIGNIVHAHATIHWTAISGTTNGVVVVLGLPYATKNASHYRSTSLMGGQVVGVHNGNNAAMNIAIGVDANQSFAYLTGVNGSSTASYNYTHQPTVNSTGQIFGFALTYLTS